MVCSFEIRQSICSKNIKKIGLNSKHSFPVKTIERSYDVAYGGKCNKRPMMMTQKWVFNEFACNFRFMLFVWLTKLILIKFTGLCAFSWWKWRQLKWPSANGYESLYLHSVFRSLMKRISVPYSHICVDNNSFLFHVHFTYKYWANCCGCLSNIFARIKCIF